MIHHQLQDMVERVLIPALQIVTSAVHKFTPEQRLALSWRLVDTAIAIMLHAGRDLGLKHVISWCKTIVSYCIMCLQPVSEQSGDAADLDFLRNVFSLQLCAYIYTNLCQLLGQINLREKLASFDRFEDLVCLDMPEVPVRCCSFQGERRVHFPESVSRHKRAISLDTSQDKLPMRKSMLSETDSFEVDSSLPDVLLEYDVVEMDDIPDGSAAPSPGPSKRTRQSSAIKLRDKWQAAWTEYWQDAVHRQPARARPAFQFQNRLLQAFGGHTSGIKCATAASGNELTILTGSRDKSVRVWSLEHLRSEESWTPSIAKGRCRHVYAYHNKPVTALLALPHSNLIASTDGSLHLWDVTKGVTQRTFALSRQSVTALECSSSSPVLYAGSSDGYVSLIDSRTSNELNGRWKAMPTMLPNGPYLSNGQSLQTPLERQVIASMRRNGDQLLVASVNSRLASLDARMGMIDSYGHLPVSEVTAISLAPGAGPSTILLHGAHRLHLHDLLASQQQTVECSYDGIGDIHDFAWMNQDLIGISSSRLGVLSGTSLGNDKGASIKVKALVAGSSSLSCVAALPLLQAVVVCTDGGGVSVVY